MSSTETHRKVPLLEIWPIIITVPSDACSFSPAVRGNKVCLCFQIDQVPKECTWDLDSIDQFWYERLKPKTCYNKYAGGIINSKGRALLSHCHDYSIKNAKWGHGNRFVD